jgi:hypothetical protein
LRLIYAATMMGDPTALQHVQEAIGFRVRLMDLASGCVASGGMRSASQAWDGMAIPLSTCPALSLSRRVHPYSPFTPGCLLLVGPRGLACRRHDIGGLAGCPDSHVQQRDLPIGRFCTTLAEIRRNGGGKVTWIGLHKSLGQKHIDRPEALWSPGHMCVPGGDST